MRERGNVDWKILFSSAMCLVLPLGFVNDLDLLLEMNQPASKASGEHCGKLDLLNGYIRLLKMGRGKRSGLEKDEGQDRKFATERHQTKSLLWELVTSESP